MALGLTPIQIIEKGTHPQLVIADNWKRVQLKHIATVQNGFAFSSKLFNHNEGLPLIRIRDIFSSETQNLYSGEYKDEFLVSKGDILIGMDGDFKVSKWPGKKGLLNQRVCRILFNSNHYEKEFLFLCIQPYLEAIHSETSAVTVKHLSSRTINDIPFPLPPLVEQKAIVKKIEELFSSLDSGIADLKKAQDQLVIYRQAVLKKAFEGELTKEWREKQTNLPSADELLEQIKEERQRHYETQVSNWEEAVKVWEENGKESKKPVKPKVTKELPSLTNEELEKLSILPKNWKWVKNEKYLFEVKDGTHDTPKYKNQGIPFITQKNIKNNTVLFDDVKYISEEDHAKFYKRSNVSFGDIIIAMIGHGRGNCCIVDTQRIFSIKNVGLFKFFKSIHNNKYCLHYYQSTLGLNLALRKSKGGAQPFIGLTELRNWPIPICSKQEQHQIVLEIESRLSVCDTVEKDIADSLEKAQALRQSILKKAFEGKLLNEEEIAKCKADTTYEPASVLLEKIKAEKLAKETITKKPKKKTAKKKPPVPQKISTDIQAGVISKVIQLHEDNPKYLNNLTHVKCEKISHLVEYHLQIPLGRVPVKDADGPDDYNHLKKVEHRASMAGYFKVVKKEIGHTYSASRNITKAIDNLENKVTTEQKEQLDDLINLFLKFDLERAEIIATLYAGWNNLMIDGKTPTDDEIVYESRENWSKRKLTIKRECFYKALQWMRKKEVALIPLGYGAKVLKPNKPK